MIATHALRIEFENAPALHIPMTFDGTHVTTWRGGFASKFEPHHFWWLMVDGVAQTGQHVTMQVIPRSVAAELQAKEVSMGGSHLPMAAKWGIHKASLDSDRGTFVGQVEISKAQALALSDWAWGHYRTPEEDTAAAKAAVQELVFSVLQNLRITEPELGMRHTDGFIYWPDEMESV